VHVGLVGAGRIGAYHARVLRDTVGVTRLTVADADEARARAVATATGAAWEADAETLVERGVDALVIAAATPAHAPLIHLALDAGLPCFCEKPVALDLETTDAVVAHADRVGTPVQMGFQRRFDPGYTAAREAVRSGALGRLYLVRLAGHDPAPPHEGYVPDSGGIFRDLHIHDFDVLRWLTGREVVEVYADGSVLADRMFERYGDVDTAAAVLRLDDGALAILSGARHDPLGYDIRTELYGSGDSIAVGMDRHTPLRSVESGVAAPTEAYTDFVHRFDTAYRRELRTFVAVAADGGQSPCTPLDARRALEIAVAADRSRAERRPVRIAEVA
jgi:myo-inositol 2-dehydrogenase/D-chiro-inositol 1-dehydrogenase